MNCTGDLLSALKEPTVNLRIQMKKGWLACTQAAHAKSACCRPRRAWGYCSQVSQRRAAEAPSSAIAKKRQPWGAVRPCSILGLMGSLELE